MMKREKQRRIVELAMRAPNVDNAQPFYFQWEGNRLLIFRDEKRDRRRGNAGNYISMVGLGCLAEYVAIAASGEGLSAALHFRYDEEHLDRPWLSVAFDSEQGGADDLLPGLKIRCSDRRLYEGGTLADPVFGEIAADVVDIQGANLYFEDSSNQKLIAYVLQCEEFLWADKEILPEILSWVRWNQEEVRRTRDGVPWQSLGVSFLTSRLMKFVATSEIFRKLARRSGGPLRAQQKTVEAQIRSSAALGCITVEDARPETMFKLGRVFVRTWVRLNLSGFGVQVMANPAIHAFQYAADIIPEDYPVASKRTFAQGERILTEAFGVGEGEIPAWMFRTGKSSPLPAEMRTLRRPLSSVVQSKADRSVDSVGPSCDC